MVFLPWGHRPPGARRDGPMAVGRDGEQEGGNQELHLSSGHLPVVLRLQQEAEEYVGLRLCDLERMFWS